MSMAPGYQELKSISKEPNGLREHMKQNLDGILPTLLNNERSALNPEVIKTIGAGNYKAIVLAANGDEQQVTLIIVKVE